MGCIDVSPYRGICGCCVSLFKWIPVIVISGIVSWSYYAYVVHLCIQTIESDVEKSILLILYHISITFFLSSYWRTVWTNPGTIPKKFNLTSEELDTVESYEAEDDQRRMLEQIVIEKDLPVSMRTIQGAIRYCEKCACIKPDRAHHCSVCGQCVLKMDHHCPWVNNCVAFNNYKFFILFLFYGLVYCLFVALSTLKYFLRFWTQSMASEGYGKFHILFLFFVSAMFSISLCSLLGYHIHLVLNNRTTLEAFRAPVFRRGPDKEGFSLGKRGNIAEVFGDICWKMALPVFSSFGDGLTYPQRFVEDPEMGLNNGLHNSTSSNVRWVSVMKKGWNEDEEECMPMLSQDHVANGWTENHHSDEDDEDSDSEVLVRQNKIDKNFVNISIQS